VLCMGTAFWRCLPETLFNDPLSTVLISNKGQLLGARIAADHQWRFPTSNKLNPKYEQALLLYEDKRFYSHFGIDPFALLRALYLNLSQGQVVSGASTISMQVMRLSQKNPARSYFEKLKEIILTLRLELRFDKKQILAMYANNAPFGGNVVGIDTAAWRYFGRGLQQLSWAESAMLAVLPNSPALIHPGRNRQALKNKRDTLLKLLYGQKLLSSLELQLAILEPLPEKPVPLPRLAPHLLDTLLQQNESLRKSGQIKRKQSRFNTTIDRSLQRAVNKIVARHAQKLSQQEINNIAALVIDNDNFEVLAYVGNSGVINGNHGNAIDIIRRPRSTGSVLKPFLFARMLELGEILPETLIPDVPTQYAGYSPKNYDRRYRGAVPAKVALARSLNIPAVRMLRRHGVAQFYEFLKKIGMSTLHRSADGYGLTLILGGAEGNLWDIATMYANLAQIAKQKGRDDNARYQRLSLTNKDSAADEATKLGEYAEITPAAAWLTLNALVEVNRPGSDSYWKNFNSSQKVAWKTGTSYGLRDGWAIGTTTKYTVAVWVGNASGEGRPALTGSATAAPILFDIFNRLPTAPWFTRPVDQMKQVRVCKADGYLADEHCASKKQWVPLNSHFQTLSPHHHWVHLDKNSDSRVHSRCESVANMQHQSWFVLPPAQAFYYRKQHSDYRVLPAYRKDCISVIAKQGKQSPIELLYPAAGARIYIPVDLAGKLSSTVFEAVHRKADTTLYWHLNDNYLGSTQRFHQQAVNLPPGHHKLTIVDEEGNRMVRRFEVLGKDSSIKSVGL